jgi:toxin YoeB
LSAKKKDKNRAKNSQPEIIIIQRQIIFDEDFQADLQWWYRQDVQKANKILDLVESVCIDPFLGIGKPEPLKFMEANTWSRRIDLEARYHYEN